MALLGKIDGVTTTVSGANSFEHFDFNFQVPLLQNKAVRQAVAQCLPRREILDKLIIPTDSNAVLQQNRLLFSGQTGYTDTSGGRYDAVDITGAKATLEADGWVLDGAVYAKGGQPLEFKLLHSASRSEEAQLIEASCAQAGISIVDDNDPGWGPRLGSGQFDAVLFTWNLSPTTSSQKSLYTTTPSPQNLLSNYGSYSNPTVDALMDQLATGTDPTTLIANANDVDTMLWSDLATIPLWRLPQVTAYSDHVQGVKPNPTDQGLTWNIETWTLS
jgi:peptide/nickel transport system substrate-binding protein